MKPISVLVVDDSPTMRAMISSVLSAEPDIEVVGHAADPLQAREAIKALSPDVLTLDVEMPNMNGIEFLERLMRLRPMPVIMISALTQEGADATLQALELGALDYIGKPRDGDIRHAFAPLPDMIRTAAASRVRARIAPPPRPAVSAAPSTFRANRNILAIGASTGGVEALQTLLLSFPENCPPTVITQQPQSTTNSVGAMYAVDEAWRSLYAASAGVSAAYESLSEDLEDVYEAIAGIYEDYPGATSAQQATMLADMRDLTTAMDGYIGYFGTYAIDTAAKVITHTVRGSSFFGYRNSVQRRHYTFSDDGRMLTLAAEANDGTRRVLVWERVTE